MTGHSRRDPTVRVGVGLVLTGFALVVAGRRTHRGPPLSPSAAASSVEEHLPEAPAPAPDFREETADVVTAPPDRPTDVSDTPGPPPSPVAPSPDLPGSVRLGGRGPSDKAVAFDAVMSRVTTLIDAATRSGMHREQPHRPAHSAVVGTLVRPESGVEEVAGPELASENSPADAQRAQEVRDAQEARRSEAIDAMDAMDAMEDIVAKAARFLAESAPYETAPKASGRTRAPRPMVFPSVEEALVALRRAGLGEDVIGPVSEGLGRGTDLETLLLEAFARLVPAPPPPRRAGSLLVVVGAGDQARCLATTLAAEIGADPDMVPFACLDADSRAAVANRLVVHTAEEAGEFAPGWRRSRPAVVVVDAPVTSNVRSWATHLITALRPTAVWGIVDATCKTEDICSWASALGGMDALALANLGATVSPGTALGVGIPVARLDGRSATAECWAATVSDAIDRSG